MPPPTVSGTNSFPAVSETMLRMVCLASSDAEMSRNVISSAPWSSYSVASSGGYPTSLRPLKLIPLTTFPSFTSRQGMILLVSMVSDPDLRTVLRAELRVPDLHRLLEGPSHRLESGLHEVVVVESPHLQDVEGDPGGHGEAPHEVQIERIGTVHIGIGPVHQVERGGDHCIVHDYCGSCHPLDGPSVHGLGERLPQGDGHILDDVVVVVPVGLQDEVE